MNTTTQRPGHVYSHSLQELFQTELEYYKSKGIPLNSHDRRILFLELKDNLDWWRNN